MAFPTTITGLAGSGAACSTPHISSGGNVYVIGKHSSTNTTVRAFKATDPTSSFSNVGTDFAVTSGNELQAVAVAQVGDVLHVITSDGPDETDVDLRYHVFNMSSDSWTTTNETIKANFNLSPASFGYRNIDVAVRSDGDVIVIYNGAKDAIMGTDYGRVDYARREAGVWTIDVALDAAGSITWHSNGIVTGSSDRMHMFYAETTADENYQRCLRSDNTLQAAPSAFYTAGVADHRQRGTSYVSGANTKVRFPTVVAGSLNSAKLDSADTPTLTQDLDIGGATSPVINTVDVYSFAATGTTLWAAFRTNADDIAILSNANDAGWSAVTTFYTGTIGTVKTSIYTRGTDVVLAFVFLETDMKYSEYTISSGGSPFDIDATATASWSGKSTNTAAFDQDAAASLTWNGTGLFKAAFDSDAVATLTWVGEAAAAASAAAWSSTAIASVTWNGTGLYPAALDSDAVASLTWNGRSFAASNFDQDALASVTWNGRSTAASALDADAVATLTWNGTGLASANWSSVAAASLTWNGTSFASSALDSDAVATLTWNGRSTASSAFDADALAVLTWNGASSNTSAWSSAAVANLTMAGTEVVNAAWSSTAAASVTWNGVAMTISASDFNLAAAASLTWNGRSTASASLSAAAAAALQWNGISTATGALAAAAAASLQWNGASSAASAWASAALSAVTWNGQATVSSAWTAAALATLSWVGDDVDGTSASGDASFTSVGDAQFASSSVASSAFEVVATTTATFVNGTVSPSGAVRFDGWRIKHRQQLELEEQEEDDMLILAAFLLAYLEQNYVYY